MTCPYNGDTRPFTEQSNGIDICCDGVLATQLFCSVQTGEVMYELSRANPTSTEEITVTITSKPIDGVDAIKVNFRTDETNIQFSPMTMVRRIIYNTTNFFSVFFCFLLL